jgi:penicillin-binding protein 1B
MSTRNGPNRRKRQNRRSSDRRTRSTVPAQTTEIRDISRGSFFLSLIRAFIFLTILSGIAILLTSYFLKDEIQKAMSKKITDSSSVVYSRPIAISKGLSVNSLNLERRLERVKYRKVSYPSSPGQYTISPSKIMLFLKESMVFDGIEQKEGLYEILLDTNGSIIEIINTQFKTEVSSIWLEPEMISVLGNTSQRVITNKSLHEFSPHLKNAILAIEDEHFYSHFGIDPFSVLRALLVNIQSGKIVQGGSTLTQQLAKNLLFSSDRSFSRKIKEAFAAILIESTYSKDQIFEMYLNEVFLGQEGRFAIHGFGEASLTFYGKDVEEISLSEAALLAGLVKAPTAYSPRNHPDKAKYRQQTVLKRMKQLRMISEEDYTTALHQAPVIYPPARSRRVAPYFVDFIQKEIGKLILDQQVDGGALHIITGLDPEYQSCAEQAVSEGLLSLEKSYPWIAKSKEKVQGALISVVPSNGEILAWVGGREYSETQFDRISSAERQPGSTFKPFVYLTALDGSLNQYRTAKTTSILVDEPLQIKIPGGIWEPQNYDKKFRGEVRLREALAKSLNVPTVQLAQKVGVKNIARTGAFFGFGEKLPQVPSLALGAGEVTPLDLTYAYSILANGGIKREFRPFYSILDSRTRSVLYSTSVKQRRITDEAPAFVLTDILRTAIESGTGQVVRQLGVKGPVAGKTGTTNDARDSWFVGYTPRILASVWVGFDSNKQLRLTGAQAAAPIWAKYMKCIERYEPELDFFPPEGVKTVLLDRFSGLLFTEHCPAENAITELFVLDTEPVTQCPLHSAEGEKEIQQLVGQTE